MVWRVCKRKMPSESGRYIVFAPSCDPAMPLKTITWYEAEGDEKGWSLLPDVWIKAITHWMPLPEDPE